LELEEKYEKLLLEIHASKNERILKSHLTHLKATRNRDFQNLLDYLIGVELVEFDKKDDAYYLTYEGYEKVEEIKEMNTVGANMADLEFQHNVKREKKQRWFVTALGIFIAAATFFALFGIPANKNSIEQLDEKVITDIKNTILTYEDSILNSRILSYIINPKTSQLDFYHKDESGNLFENHNNLKTWLSAQNKELIFAVNGGMFNKQMSPHGLYIENGKEIQVLDLYKEGHGNFYLHPNGVFYINKNNVPYIKTAGDFRASDNIKHATQSGPMLIINGEIHPKFTKGSENLHIRNGVGILPSGELLFAMSKEKINFYDFALFFQNHDCKNALYLDGFVSRTYLPSQNWEQGDGNFSIIIAQVK